MSAKQPLLRPEEVLDVLSGGAPPPEPGPQAYSLREPMAIPPAALAGARETMKRLVDALGETLSGKKPLELTLDDLQQQSATAALAALPPPAWTAGLGRAGNGGLLLALHPGVGLALVDLALGGPGTPPKAPRAPTPLESRVLQRLLAAAAGALGAVLGVALAPVECPAAGIPSAIASPGETLGVGLLRFKIGEGHQASLLLVTASLLLPRQVEAKAGRDARPGPLLPLLERVPVGVRPVLPAGSVSFQDMLAAKVGSVLRLDVEENASFELRVEERTVAHGRIARQPAGAVFRVTRRSGQPPAAPRE